MKTLRKIKLESPCSFGANSDILVAFRIIGNTEEVLMKRLKRHLSVLGNGKIEYEVYSLCKIFNFDQNGHF